MRVHEVRFPYKRQRRKRVGRGNGSGHGTYSTRGMKGQKARSGGGVRPGFEGGQLPIVKRLPTQRGFTNIFRREYHLVSLDKLSRLPEGIEATPETMVQHGLVKNLKRPIKVLGSGHLERPVTVIAHKFSRSAREKIQSLGGTVREL